MTKREQALVDQHRAWRAQIDATPEPPWEPVEPQAPVLPRQERLVESRARRAERLGRPLDSPEVSPRDHAAPAAMTRVTRLDTIITREDAEFAQWRRRRNNQRGQGTRRATRSRDHG